MGYRKHVIQEGDTLESIAKEYDISVKELVDFHNTHCAMTHQIIGEKPPMHIEEILLNPDWTVVKAKSIKEIDRYDFRQNFGYRTEMTVGTKLEDVMVDNSTSRNQYSVKLTGDRRYVAVELEENHVSSSPELVQKGMELIAAVDKIKCKSVFGVDQMTGKINKILNYEEILENWDSFKSDFQAKKTIMNISKSSKDIHDFFTTVESILKPESRLIKDYDTKMFYDIFFNQFLVKQGDFSKENSKTYFSVIFDQEPVKLDFAPSILEENDEMVKIRNVGAMDWGAINLDNIIQSYDERVKPAVHYNFSEYKYSFRETFTWDKKENILQDSHITVLEEVKNNIQLIIDFNLKQIE